MGETAPRSLKYMTEISFDYYPLTKRMHLSSRSYIESSGVVSVLRNGARKIHKSCVTYMHKFDPFYQFSTNGASEDQKSNHATTMSWDFFGAGSKTGFDISIALR